MQHMMHAAPHIPFLPPRKNPEAAERAEAAKPPKAKTAKGKTAEGTEASQTPGASMSVEPAERVTLEPIIALHGVRETLDGKPSLTVDKRNIVIRIKAFDAAGNLTSSTTSAYMRY